MIGVIGGSGFIGTRLVTRLLSAGREVRIVDIRPSVRFPGLVGPADVRDRSTLVEALRGCDTWYNLAAQHRDDVRPLELYREVNVDGAQNVCAAAEELGVPRIVFTSSVAVYGQANIGATEDDDCRPISEYGRTKLAAEHIYGAWAAGGAGRTLTVVRPTVVFGEGNRGNVYNLLNLIAKRRFMMVGNGRNRKSMAYVENVAAFLEWCAGFGDGVHLYNYADKPDMDMNELVAKVSRLLGMRAPRWPRVPYALAYPGGLALDALSGIIRRPFPISTVRMRKFCMDTAFAVERVRASGFVPPVSLAEGLERTVRYEFVEQSTGPEYHSE